MSKIKLTGESSGYVEISAGSNAGNNTLELPTSGTKLVASDTGNNVTVGGSLNVSGIATFGSSVGIGTDNPSQELEVFGDSFTGIRIRSSRTGLTEQIGGVGFSTSSDQVATINALVDGTVIVKNTTSDTERFRIDSSGNIGIGTDNPTEKLDVVSVNNTIKSRSTGNSSAKLSLDSNRAADVIGGQIISQWNGNTVSRIDFRNGADGTNKDDGYITFGTSSSGSNPTERLRIGSAGQIGLSGANYGTARQVLKSNGSDAAPTWSDLYSFYFYGEQDTQQGSWPNATYKKLQNLGNRAVNIGPSSIATWDESGGNLTIGADGAGYWFLSMNAGIDDIQTGDFVQVVIGKNGGTTSIGTRVSGYSRAYPSAANQTTDTGISTLVNLDVGDVVRFYLYHNEGTTDEHSEPSRCFAMGYKI